MERKRGDSPEHKEIPTPTDIYMVTRFADQDIGGIPSTVSTLTSEWERMKKNVKVIRPGSDLSRNIDLISQSTNYRIILHHLDMHSMQFFMAMNEEQRKNCRIILYQNIDRDSVIRNSIARNKGGQLRAEALETIDRGVEMRRWICSQPGTRTYAISNSILENLRNSQMVGANQLHRIHLPIQELHYGNISQKDIEKKAKDKQFRILCVSRVEPEKGLLTLFDIQKELAGIGGLAIDVAGDSNDQRFMDEVSEKAKITNEASSCKINFLGSKTSRELVDIYQNSHLLLSPSLIDTWGLTVVEGMAYGLPTVVFPSPGSKEIFSEAGKQSGFVVNDPAEAAAALLQMSGNRSLYQEMSLASLQNADNYSPQNVADDILLKI
jgi:glycosyltransferase involved in cell wall biosynthesis